jgi:leucyl aminopeptidase
MTEAPTIAFATLGAPSAATLAVLVGDGASFAPTADRLDRQSQGTLRRAVAAADFTGKARAALEVLGAPGIEARRVILIGTGKAEEAKDLDWMRIGGAAYAQIIARTGEAASLIVEGMGEHAAGTAALVAAGAQLRAYSFRKYLTREPQENNGNAGPKAPPRLTIHCADPDAAAKAFVRGGAVARGVYFARDLVNEPANALGPVEFAERLAALTDSGLEVDILDEHRLAELKMGALLAVGKGSERKSRVAVLQWHGARRARNKSPVCFVGKGVCFDTGGISMKPAAGMEDMKGDMGGAACVAGLMLALAARKAPVNAVGLVGLVENMPSGTATRPGDIVTSMSGQTIEVLNTDAEGRLVLADVLWYAQERFKPRLIVDLATLTGAIMVALGKEHAGLFSNNDRLVKELEQAGEATGEKVWRMPLAPAYDKLLDSKNADMKNIGGRHGGAITAAQFLQRFINDKATPWAHLDIAATAMDSGKNELNQSWGSGWGVRLLDELVARHYEKG